MAKECILCNKKLGIINGENLQGNLCDVCFSICSGYNLMNMEYENDSKRFNECYEEIATSIDKLSVAESQKNRITDLFF